MNSESSRVGLSYSEQLTVPRGEDGKQMAFVEGIYLSLDFKCELNLKFLCQEGRDNLIQSYYCTGEEPKT